MKCPGQDTQYWNKDAIFEIHCPECGVKMEFFKDDTSRLCRGCGKRVVNPNMDFGCAAYCQYAEQCIGTLPQEFIKEREDLLKDRVAVEMKRYFKSDFRRIGHAMRVARYSEQIAKDEMSKNFEQKLTGSTGANLAVILSSAYLHDIGIKESERKYNSNAPKYQELEGPPIARAILEKLGAKQALIDEVCDIVGHHHHPKDVETLNFKVLYDADLITNLEEDQKEKIDKNEEPISKERLERIIAKSFLTESGRKRAESVLL
ncbi:MAG: HD domain-containing protein [Desulfamplus sp.]|nr:HD domain-containing protein [Desulfamplus sp.]